MSVIRTGVYASATDTAVARSRADLAYCTPLIGRNLELAAQVIEMGREEFKAWLDQMAESYGLPPPGLIDGVVNHYGMSDEGEFTRYERERSTDNG